MQQLRNFKQVTRSLKSNEAEASGLVGKVHIGTGMLAGRALRRCDYAALGTVESMGETGPATAALLTNK